MRSMTKISPTLSSSSHFTPFFLRSGSSGRLLMMTTRRYLKDKICINLRSKVKSILFFFYLIFDMIAFHIMIIICTYQQNRTPYHCHRHSHDHDPCHIVTLSERVTYIELDGTWARWCERTTYLQIVPYLFVFAIIKNLWIVSYCHLRRWRFILENQ